MRKDTKKIDRVYLNGNPLTISTIEEPVNTIDPCIETLYKEEKYQPKYKKPCKVKIDAYSKQPILSCRSLSMTEIFQKVIMELNENYQNKFGLLHPRAKGKIEKIWQCYKALPKEAFLKKDIYKFTSKYLSSSTRVKGLLIVSGLIIEKIPGSFVKEILNDIEALEMIIDAKDDLMGVDSKRHLNQDKIRKEKRQSKEEEKEDNKEIFTVNDNELMAFVKSFDLFKTAFPKLGLIKFVELWYKDATEKEI